MSNTLIAPELEMFPDRYRWKVEDCYRLMDLGILEGRFEVLDGEVIRKMGQKPPHAVTLPRLLRLLAVLVGLERLRIQSPISLEPPDSVYSEPEPDIVVTAESEDAYGNRHPGPQDISLLIEVSDTTLRTDLIVKARLYARAGIEEYWTLDLNGRQLYIHRSPENGEYRTISIHADTDLVSAIALTGAPMAVADMFPALMP